MARRVDWLTIVGLGLLLMPLLTMWHEIGGHAAACVVTGGQVHTIAAFYVDCDAPSRAATVLVACAGVFADAVLALIGWAVWRRVRGDLARLVWWLVATTKGFVAAGYFLFSGVSGLGDLGPGEDGGIGPLAAPLVWRIVLTLVGAVAYWRLAVFASRRLNDMLGTSPETRTDRRTIAHVYYLAMGIAAVIVGLFNPVGLFVLLASAAASTFGGNAGLISIGFAVPKCGERSGFAVGRHWSIVIAGLVATIAFAAVLGSSIHLLP